MPCSSEYCACNGYRDGKTAAQRRQEQLEDRIERLENAIKMLAQYDECECQYHWCNDPDNCDSNPICHHMRNVLNDACDGK